MTELKHHYGERFHLIDDLFSQSLLTKLCISETQQPEMNRIVQQLYTNLVTSAANQIFPKIKSIKKTRMNADLESDIIDPNTKAVTVNLARAGTFPSHICYEFLHWILKPENIRQDHIFAPAKWRQHFD